MLKLGMDEILEDFKAESKSLIKDLLEILEDIEGDYSKKQKLEEFGQLVDRIMGGAQSVAMGYDAEHQIHRISKYAELCKLVGYKASQIEKNEQFYNIVIALLLDAVEMLDELVTKLETEEEKNIQEILSKTFLERLQWVSEHFDENMRASVAVTEDEGQKMSQNQIDDLLKSLGMG